MYEFFNAEHKLKSHFPEESGFSHPLTEKTKFHKSHRVPSWKSLFDKTVLEYRKCFSILEKWFWLMVSSSRLAGFHSLQRRAWFALP